MLSEFWTVFDNFTEDNHISDGDKFAWIGKSSWYCLLETYQISGNYTWFFLHKISVQLKLINIPLNARHCSELRKRTKTV